MHLHTCPANHHKGHFLSFQHCFCQRPREVVSILSDLLFWMWKKHSLQEGTSTTYIAPPNSVALLFWKCTCAGWWRLKVEVTSKYCAPPRQSAVLLTKLIPSIVEELKTELQMLHSLQDDDLACWHGGVQMWGYCSLSGFHHHILPSYLWRSWFLG